MPCRHLKLRTALLLVTLTGPLPLFAAKPTHPPKGHTPKIHVHDQIMTLEQQWRTAQMANDTTAMDRLLSEDFLGITGNGQVVTKAQQLDRMKSHQFALTRVDMSDEKIKVVGQVAIVTSRAEIEGTSDGEPLKGDFRYTRVYQRLPNNTWKITSFEATRVPPAYRDSPRDVANAKPPASSPESQK